jgi:nitrogen fixation protein FixH
MTTTKPRRSLWPYAIIAAFAIFISGTVALVVLACSQRVDLVSSDYYEQEIKFQNHLDRLRRTRNLDVQGAVGYDSTKQQITISVPTDQLRRAVSGRIQLYRPSAAGLDRQVVLSPDSKGVQVVDAKDLQPGLWKVRVSWTVGDNDYFMDQKIVVGSRNRS